jgi:ribosomal protein S7
VDNNIIHESMQRRHFKKAQVPFYKRHLMSPIQVLNSIMNGEFKAPMLMTTFPVEILVPSQNKLNINTITTTLKDASQWISTNKKLSADKSISKRLAEELANIMDFSNPTDKKQIST